MKLIIETNPMSGIIEDEIIDIKINNESKEVYDVCVPDVHNFIANGIVSHNTISAIYIFTVKRSSFRRGLKMVLSAPSAEGI